MDYALLFKIVNVSVIPAWGLLMFAPKSKFAHYLVYSHAYPYFLGLFYAYLIFSSFFGSGEGGMDSLEAVREGFSNDGVLLAGWIHYLIFDLFIGSWQVKDAHENGIKHVKIIPALVFTLLLGPVGLLIYLVMKQFEIRSRVG